MNVLVLCTGNSCRSQMAEAYLRSLDPRLEVHSAGTHPAARIHPYAVEVMREIGIDLGGARPKSVDEFLALPFDYVITVCDNAKDGCPAFTGSVKHRLHLGFDDPADATGTREEVLGEFRRVRDEIRARFGELYRKEIAGALRT
jgi:arsenate reductase